MELYMKGSKTTEISSKMGMYISQNLNNYDYTYKSDIVDDHTFVKHVLFEKESQEVKYIYHYDPGVREYICLYSEKDPIKLLNYYSKKSVTDYICARLKPMFEIVNEFNIVDKQESTDNTRYEYTMISNIIKSATSGKHKIFPIERVVYQSAETIVVLFMSSFSKCMIIGFDTEHTKKYNYRPDQEIIELIYQDLQSILVDRAQEVVDNAYNDSGMDSEEMKINNLILEQKAKLQELKEKSKKKNKNDGLETLTF